MRRITDAVKSAAAADVGLSIDGTIHNCYNNNKYTIIIATSGEKLTFDGAGSLCELSFGLVRLNVDHVSLE